MQILSRADVEARLDLDALIDALAPAMADLSSGAASSPARTIRARTKRVRTASPLLRRTPTAGCWRFLRRSWSRPPSWRGEIRTL